jgi:predicted NBD/HSP70 family sugar kinase
MGTLTPRELELLQLAHSRPGLTRAHAATALDAGSGTVTMLTRSLVAARLLEERRAQPTGGRGRPTTELAAHRGGPLVLSGIVDHENWRISAAQIGGEIVAVEGGTHDGQDGAALVDNLREGAAVLLDRFPGRVLGMAVALPGVVQGTRLLDAPFLGYRDVELRFAWPGQGPFVAGNDATFAALAEARRGAATDAKLHLHLHLDAGLGGAVTAAGEVLVGAQGLGGEFGHMPFGNPALRCPCGAMGCWTTAVGAGALAMALGERLPRDALSYARRVLERAQGGEAPAYLAVAGMAACLGRGIAGLVNGLDADLVTLGGLAPLVAEVAPEALSAALDGGLMRWRRHDPPPIRGAALGDAAVQVGGAEQVWSQLWQHL